MYKTGHDQTNPIDFGECQMHSFFYKSTKNISYRFQPMVSNSLKGSSIQMMHLIELKLGMYITIHHRAKATDFDEFLMHSFFTGVQKRIFIHYSLWSQIL